MKLLAILLLALPSDHSGPATIQPHIWASPSGEWRFSSDPSSKFGDGPSHVDVTRGSETAWTADLGFTFWDARISDQGVVAGYGFTAGSKARRSDQLGDLVVAILASDGNALLRESVSRSSSNFPHSPPNPDPSGLFVQPALDRFVLRVADADLNRANQEWWTYRLSTGEALGRVHPRDLLGPSVGVRTPIDARPVLGTPLTLVQWYQVDEGGSGALEPGTRFVLVGEDWRPVWTLELAREYCHQDEEEADRLRDEAWESGGILAAEAPGRFELRHVATKERVTYEVTTNPGREAGWSVREVSRAPYAVQQVPELPALSLRKVATVFFQTDGPRASGPIRDLVTFDFDEGGELRCVRSEESGFTVFSLDAAGAAVREVHVDDLAPDAEGYRAWYALGRNRWLFTLSPYGENVVSRAWFVEPASGAATEIEGFAGPFVRAVDQAADGGFVVVGSFQKRNTLNEALIAFDAAGARRWEHVTESYSGDPAELMGVQDIAVEPDGDVLVLDSVRKAVQVFDAGGRHQRSIELAGAVGEDSYLSALRVDPSGGWLVRQFQRGRADEWHRVDSEGRRLGSVVLRSENGHIDGYPVHVDPQGHLWSTDGQALYRADEEGVLRPRFGSVSEPDELEEAWWVTFDGRGRIAIVDRRSRSIHLFSAGGAREQVLHPETADFEDRVILPAVIAAPDDRVFVCDAVADRWLEFSADGRRVGWLDVAADQLAFRPDGGRWEGRGSRYEATSVSGLGPNGRAGPTISRRPDGRFFLSIDALACGPDGALFVLTASASGLRSDIDAIDVFNPVGEPVRTIPLGAGSDRGWDELSVGRRWVVVSSSTNEAVLVPRHGGQPSLVRVDEGKAGKACAFALSPDETELWCATVEPLALHRYALPD